MFRFPGRRSSPNRFLNARDAKEYLIDKIVQEATREGVSLSEIERKMLYFSETGWTLPDIVEVNEAFGREYSQPEYEEKIGRLARNTRQRMRKQDKQGLAAWDDAARVLEKEDHYLLAILDLLG